MPEENLQELARRLAQLRHEMDLENAAFDALHERILDIRRRCDALTRDIGYARKRAAEAAAPEKAPAPQPQPFPPAAEHVRAMRAEPEEKEKIEEKKAPLEPEVAEPVSAEPKGEVPFLPPERALHEVFAKPPTEERPESSEEMESEEVEEVQMGEALSSSMSRLVSRLESSEKPEPEPALPRKALPVRNLETAIGSYWFSRLGAISLLVGFVIAAGYIQARLTPALRVGLGYLAAAVLCAIGLWAEKAYPKFSRPVLAAGLVLAFFTSFAGYFIRPTHCFTLSASTTLMLITAAAVIVVAGALKSQPLGALALAMGFWVAFFAAELAEAFTPVMLVFLSAVAVALFVAFRWATLMPFGVLGVYFCAAWWMFLGKKSWQGESLFWIEMEFVTAYFLVFLAGDIIGRLRNPKETLLSIWQTFLPVNECVLIGRFINPVAYILIGSLIFWETKIFWETIHYFYWPLGVALAAIGFAGRRIEREATNEEDIFYVLSSGLITLGFASAFKAMSLSNVLALEGLCLFALRCVTGRAVFHYLSAIHYVSAFVHFNLRAFHIPLTAAGTVVLQPALVTNWTAFGTGLPAVLFTLAPTFLAPLWSKGDQEGGTTNQSIARSLGMEIPLTDERVLRHIRALAGSLLLLRLFFETVRPETIFGLWVLLAPAILAAAWTWRHAPAAWTLGGSFLAWAHLCFFPQLEQVEVGDPWWMFPAAIALTLVVLGIGFLSEALTRGRIYEPTERESRADTGWGVLTAVLILLAVADVTVLIQKRADFLVRYPLANAFAVGLILTAIATRRAFPILTGLFLLAVNSLLLLESFLRGTPISLPALFMWTLVGSALAVVFARCFRAWAQTLLRRVFDSFRYGSNALVVLTTLVLLGVAYTGLRLAQQYETIRWMPITAMTLFVLALGLFVETLAGREVYQSGECEPGTRSAWAGLISASILLAVVHLTVLITQRADSIHHYPYAAASALALMGFALLTRMAFPCLTGLFLLALDSLIVLGKLAGSSIELPGFFAWTVVGAALAVVFERGFHAQGEKLLRRAFVLFQRAPIVLITLVALIFLGLAHFTPWIRGRYETVGVTTGAIALLALGIGFRSATYRRFGLAIFLYALARVYLADLSGLETVYKIIAFLVLGAVLIAVSYLYTRFKEQFQKWV